MRRSGDFLDNDEHAELLAFWGPFLHLIGCGLGWPWPAIGISRWMELGRPLAHPVLNVVQNWWGPYLRPFLDWGATSGYYQRYWMRVAEVTAWKAGTSPLIAPRLLSSGDHSASPFGPGGDSMHVMTHISPIGLGPVDPAELFTVPKDAELVIGRADDPVPRATLLLKRYAGWYSALNGVTEHLPEHAKGRSWRVDVVVKPLGWLGTYRKSRNSERWFSGQHRWHQLGI